MTNATLSATSFRAAWEHLDLGAMPIVLHVQEPPAPWSRLTAQGLARGGELDPWIGAAFKLLAHPPRSLDLRLGIGRSSVRALAASAGNGSLLAVLTGDRITVRELEVDLATALVDLLPAMPDGRVGGPDLRGQFGAAVIDHTGRRRRAVDVVELHGFVDAATLRARLNALLDGF
ncbi:ESX secretion-associated protein EspG [Saccharothrix syringae]|uniref:ESX secretion-associated protein EspG n=1 Tax=Saccharothrix syringae TaxID=103733 RepID=A0A5Q0HBU8_SACSY|nr:ESX secretion-associated protein EspG [Saccharothrix syringae]QFZ23747.1 ESX secretion-associated protein EspG [Saccharothrix syringae]